MLNFSSNNIFHIYKNNVKFKKNKCLSRERYESVPQKCYLCTIESCNNVKNNIEKQCARELSYKKVLFSFNLIKQIVAATTGYVILPTSSQSSRKSYRNKGHYQFQKTS